MHELPPLFTVYIFLFCIQSLFFLLVSWGVFCWCWCSNNNIISQISYIWVPDIFCSCIFILPKYLNIWTWNIVHAIFKKIIMMKWQYKRKNVLYMYLKIEKNMFIQKVCKQWDIIPTYCHLNHSKYSIHLYRVCSRHVIITQDQYWLHKTKCHVALTSTVYGLIHLSSYQVKSWCQC